MQLRILSRCSWGLGSALTLVSILSPAHAVIAPGPQGNTLADPSEWSSVLLLAAGAAYCSTTVVGPQVLLTAAHCVASQRGEVVVAAIAIDGRIDYRMVCGTDPRLSHFPASYGGADADLALCKTDRPLPVTRIERIHPSALTAGAKVTLVGYGCRDAASRNFDGRLSAGEATVQAGARGQAVADAAVSTVGAAACPGDGGGGVFLIATSQGAERVLVGVISRTDVVSRTVIAPVVTEAFLRWAKQWSADASAPVCGLSDDQPAACVARPQEAPAVNPSPEPPPRGVILLARPTFAPSVVANNQPGRSTSNDVQLRQVFHRRGEVLEAVVQISCYGTADEAYLTRVLAHLEREGRAMARDHAFADPGILTIPVCPPAASAGSASDTLVVPVTREGSKSLWTYFQQVATYKKLGERWLFEYRQRDGPRVTPPGPNSRYFVDVFKELNPTQNPRALTIGQIRLPLRPRPVATLDEPAANIETLEPFAAVASPDESCSKSQDDLTYPFDLVGLLDTLAGNARARDGPILEAARIVILDSGLYVTRREETIFRRVLHVDRPGVVPAARREFLNRIEPRLPQPAKAVHGTHVASVALGGPLFARIQASITEPPRIRLDPYRLHESRGGTVIMPADKFPDVLRDLNPRGVAIVNLSLGTSNTLSPVLDRLEIKVQTSFLLLPRAITTARLAGKSLAARPYTITIRRATAGRTTRAKPT